MAVRVRGLSRSLRPHRTVLLLVRCRPEVAEAAARGLGEAAADLRALAVPPGSVPGLSPADATGPKLVGEPVRTPLGPLLLADLGDTPAAVLRTVPDVIVNRLAAAGVDDAVLEPPPTVGPWYEDVRRLGPAVGTWWYGALGEPFGTAARRPPLELFRLAAGWLRDEAPAGVEPVELVVSAELPVTWDTLAEAAEPVLRSGSPVTLAATDRRTSLTALTVGSIDFTDPAAALARVGVDGSAEDLASVMLRRRDGIREGVRGGVPVAWAAVGVQPTAGGLFGSATYESRDPGAPSGAVRLVCDQVAPDALWYQVLTRGHLERLGGVPDDAVLLGDGVAELTIGEPAQWLPGHPDRDAIHRHARRRLAGVLVDRAEAFRLGRDRMALARTRDTSGFFRH